MTSGAGVGVCSTWITADEITCGSGSDYDKREAAVQIATDVLYVLSGQHWPGLCNRTVRPRVVCSQGCWQTWMAAGSPWAPWPYSLVPAPGRCSGRHDPTGPSRIRIPGPVAEIDEIVIDGDALDTGAYMLQGSSTLVRLDGEAWPTANNLTRAANTANDGGDPAWQIAYVWGAEPPASGVAACRDLACEIVLAMEGAEDCRLLWGAQVQSQTRRGVTVTYQSLGTALADGLTGLDSVDLWINTARGGKFRRRARVIRADAPKRRGVWTV